MVKLDIYAGLLGNGKTTLIQQMLKTAYNGYKVAIVENEFGKVNLDTAVLETIDITVKEISSGCICCTLKGNVTEAIMQLAEQEEPDYILVEPTGMADIQEVLTACLTSGCVIANRIIFVVNASRIQKLLAVGGEFFFRQFRIAPTIYLNFSEMLLPEELDDVKNLVRGLSSGADIIDIPIWDITKDTFSEISSAAKSYIVNADSAVPIKSSVHMKMVASSKSYFQKLDKNSLKSWSYKFCCSFTEEKVQELLKIFTLSICSEIFRVKGYLKMQNCKIAKIDCAFGDSFLEIIDEFTEDKLNYLVMIGRKISVDRLLLQFHEIESQSQ